MPEPEAALPESRALTQPIGQMIADNLLIETGVPECSIAASDIAKDADDLFKKGHLRTRTSPVSGEDKGSALVAYMEFLQEDRTLHMADEAFIPKRMDMRSLDEAFVTESGRHVQFALAAPAAKPVSKWDNKEWAPGGKLQLFAITRDLLAFPLVTFSRDDRKYCDYLQFWGEDEMSELESENFYGWGTDDNGSRFDAVQAVGNVLNKPDEAASQKLAELLNVDGRIEQRLGSTSPDAEALIDAVFRVELDGKRLRLKHEYLDVQMGRNTTDITVSATLEEVEDKPLRRRLFVNQYPSSQPVHKDWPERAFFIDLYSGITTLKNDGEESAPTDLEVNVIRELLETGGELERTHAETWVETLFNREVYLYQAIGFVLIGASEVTLGWETPAQAIGSSAFFFGSYVGVGTYLKHRRERSVMPELPVIRDEEEI